MNNPVQSKPMLDGRKHDASRRKMTAFVSVGVVAAGMLAFFWPDRDEAAGYPLVTQFADRLPTVEGIGGDLSGIPAQDLRVAIRTDAMRLREVVTQLDRAVLSARKLEHLLSRDDVEEWSSRDRQRVRELWWSFVDPLLMAEKLKLRYRRWYAIDYRRHPSLHSKAYALSFTALCAQLDAGHALMVQLEGNTRVQALLNEAVPELGMPEGTFQDLRRQIDRKSVV